MAECNSQTQPTQTVERLYTADEIKLMPTYVDPYRYQRRYHEKRRAEDPDFCNRRREQSRINMSNKYHSDPEYREKKKKAVAEWRARKAAARTS